MISNRLWISLAELGYLIVISGLIIVLIYQIFLRTYKRHNIEEALIRGNIAVGIFMASIMVSSALMLQKGVSASMSVFRLTLSTPAETGLKLNEAILLVCTHLVLSLTFIVLTIATTLYLFNLLSRKINPEMDMGQQLKQGNIAIGILISGVVLITTLYAGNGISGVTKSLVPQPNVGTIRIMQ